MDRNNKKEMVIWKKVTKNPSVELGMMTHISCVITCHDDITSVTLEVEAGGQQI
jgi:hypothetical protein